MADKYPLVSSSEQESLILSLIKLISQFPDLPKAIKSKGISFYDIFPNMECMGIATIGSAIILKKFIGNSYIGQYKFRLQYRYSTKNSKERIQKQSLLSTIGEWLSGGTIYKDNGDTYKLSGYPEFSPGKNIFSINITGRTILIDKNSSGYEDSIVDAILEYHVSR